jgi:KTSC domain
MPEMKLVYSSHIDAIGYDPLTGELHVNWSRGGMTIYGNADNPVPPDLAREVLSSPSFGEALHLGIRGRFPHRTVKPE